VHLLTSYCFYGAQSLRISQYKGSTMLRPFFTHLAMQALVLLCIIWFRVIRFGEVWFGASYANLRCPHIFKQQSEGKSLVLHSSKCTIINLLKIYKFFKATFPLKCKIITWCPYKHVLYQHASTCSSANKHTTGPTVKQYKEVIFNRLNINRVCI